MGIDIKLYPKAIKRIEDAAKQSSLSTMEQLHTDLVSAQTMPFDTGDMQNNQTFVDQTEDGAVLVTGSPQARRLYYHPEYNFQRGHNANAGAGWLDPYIAGDKSDFVQNAFAADFKKRAGV